ncbi:hypothetical protein K503DRAFT_774513, partial [Rhizopogon vinicolor AM-OR11-026]
SPRLHPTYSLSIQSTQHPLLTLSTTLAPPGLSPLSPPHNAPHPPSSSLNLPMTGGDSRISMEHISDLRRTIPRLMLPLYSSNSRYDR